MAFLKKNGFWIANFLLAATMIGVWFFETGRTTKLAEEQIGKIKSKVSAIDAVKRVSAEEGVAAHPNETTAKGMELKLQKLADSIANAWSIRYQAQQNIMKWPDEILFGAAGKRFREEFSKYNPPETLPLETTGYSEEMKLLLRVYKQQIPSEMANICSIIKSDWQFQDQLDAAIAREDVGSGGDTDKNDPAGAGAEVSEEEKERQRKEAFETGRQIVAWNSTNQQLWLEKLTRFKGRDDNSFSVNLPTPSQVYMLQQDLWLLEAMFEIIRNVNAQRDSDGNMVIGADGKPVMVPANDLAAIKRIDHIVFGREALSRLGTITDTISAAEQKSASRAGGGARPRPGGAGGGGSKSSDLGFAYRGQPAFHGRYVNEKLEPIEAEKIQKSVTATTLPAENLEVVVAKRVPVRLAVQMDERKIASFLAACANSPFAFEVWQVRINRHDSDEQITLRGSEGGGQGAGAAGRDDDDRQGRGRDESQFGSMEGGGGSGGSANLANTGSGSSGATSVAVRGNFDVGVEFYGIVKIYNPVNETVLGRQKNDAAGP